MSEGEQPGSPSLTQTEMTMDATIIAGNMLLSRGEAEASITLYNNVLYKRSPGHVGALLNRSLAYLSMSYYELAAADAYTAYLASKDMRNHEIEFNNQRLRDTRNYLRLEASQVEDNEFWTIHGDCNVRGHWAASPLASIVINDIPQNSELKGFPAQADTFKVSKFPLNDRGDLCDALEVRAMYRVAGALHLCGGGARNEAMGFIDDALAMCKAKTWEVLYFRSLGDEIMKDFMTELSEGSRTAGDVGTSQGSSGMSDSSYFEQASRMTQMKSNFFKNSTILRNKGYAEWDTWEPELSDPEWRVFLRNWITQYTENCRPYFVSPEDISDDKSPPYAELRASRAIKPPALVLSEPTLFNLTTNDPEKSFDQRKDDDGHQQYCDTCATLMNIKEDCTPTYQRNVIQATARQRPAPAPAPPSHQELPQRPSPDFMFCSKFHVAPSCTKECRTARQEFDRGLCGTFIENQIRICYLSPLFEVGSDEERKIDCLHDLIFLRVMTIAINTDRHPLEVSDIVFATSGFDNKRKADQPRVWSFKKNVSRPLLYIHSLLTRLGRNPYDYLEHSEPWIINTLLCKIRSATRITMGPRFSKFFHSSGKLDAAYASGQVRKDEHYFRTPAEKGVRVGRLNSIFNMIRIADKEKGENPNIAVVQRENMECFAIRPIAVGEPLLRLSDAILDYCYAGGIVADEKDDDNKSEDKDGGENDEFTGEDGARCLDKLERCAQEDRERIS